MNKDKFYFRFKKTTKDTHNSIKFNLTYTSRGVGGGYSLSVVVCGGHIVGKLVSKNKTILYHTQNF